MNNKSVVLPAVRIPRKLWLYLEEIMKRKMFSSRAELIKDALREYVARHRELIPDLDVTLAFIELKEGRFEDEEREKDLFEWIEKIRSRH